MTEKLCSFRSQWENLPPHHHFIAANAAIMCKYPLHTNYDGELLFTRLWCSKMPRLLLHFPLHINGHLLFINGQILLLVIFHWSLHLTLQSNDLSNISANENPSKKHKNKRCSIYRYRLLRCMPHFEYT